MAEKFQTGFDEPRLHTMYVDNVLMGLNGVGRRNLNGVVDTDEGY